jgi:hypothetical protein
MRRTYISPEFDYSRVYGTYNMKEQSSPFGSKMLEIEDSVYIDNQSLVYFQNLNKEQLDLIIESSLPPVSYSSSEDKRLNHTLVLDPSQGVSQKDTDARWILTIDLKTILTNFIFATLKRWRTFEGVKNEMTKNGDVDFAIREYIIKNVLDRYKLVRVDLYVKYVDIQNQSVLKYNNLWAGTSNIGQPTRTASLPADVGTTQYQLKKFQSQTEYDFSSTIITFTQEKNATQYCFDYFFKLYYEKI